MERRLRNTRKQGDGLTSRLPGRFKKRWRAPLLAVILVLVIAFAAHGLPVHSDDGPGTDGSAFQSPLPLIWKYPLGERTPVPTGITTPGDLLINGNMDQMGFYWRPPNHWIAGAWFEWFSTGAFNFPEFNDGYERGFFHTWPSSERLQLWANDYAGGLMQSVAVTPCITYQFQAYGQSRPGGQDPPPVPVESHMKVGIEPYGWMAGRSILDYDPGLEPENIPDTVIWSPEATHNFVFAPYQVTAEAWSDTLTVILYSYPEVDVAGGVWWNDTIWDTASLLQVPAPSDSLLDDGVIPEPDGLITSIGAQALPHTTIVEWNTSVEASTQLVYRVLEPSAPVTPTTLLLYATYLPFITTPPDTSTLTGHSSADTTPVRRHRVVVTGLPAFYSIDFVALSRRLEGNTCVTSASGITRAESSNEGAVIYLPTLWRGE